MTNNENTTSRRDYVRPALVLRDRLSAVTAAGPDSGDE
ncbi:hypothetical protein GGQ63_003512 [Prosthecomicrobium pneumaticum]|uniref:Uncharacterized protein n=1 Tax=Prosthecomicrobium pneumaticum TaxID=81895 RepID=A0A7W9FPK5_9HYPH|nr:hypothetical protein [Prosthecomicrobium pneumaticum]